MEDGYTSWGVYSLITANQLIHGGHSIRQIKLIITKVPIELSPTLNLIYDEAC